MNREPAESELVGAAGSPAQAALPPAGDSEIDDLRLQRLQSMLLLRDRRLLAMRLSFGLERLSRDLGRAFTRSVGLRFIAIRLRHRVSVARLTMPRSTTGAE